jgi:hypothetical protein
MNDEDRIEHVSDAYGEVSSALGIERLRLGELADDAGEMTRQRQVWRVERLERALEHLRAALLGTPRERPTAEQIRALNEGA